MKAYLLDTINKYKRFSESLDVKITLCNKSWWVFNDCGEKEIYIFSEDGSLIVSVCGKVTNATWKYISANKSIIINNKEESYMLNPAFMDGTILAMQLDGTNNCFIMIDENNSKSFKPNTLIELNQYFENKLLEANRAEKLRLEKIENEKRIEIEKANELKREQELIELEIRKDKEVKAVCKYKHYTYKLYSLLFLISSICVILLYCINNYYVLPIDYYVGSKIDLINWYIYFIWWFIPVLVNFLINVMLKKRYKKIRRELFPNEEPQQSTIM